MYTKGDAEIISKILKNPTRIMAVRALLKNGIGQAKVQYMGGETEVEINRTLISFPTEHQAKSFFEDLQELMKQFPTKS